MKELIATLRQQNPEIRPAGDPSTGNGQRRPRDNRWNSRANRRCRGMEQRSENATGLWLYPVRMAPCSIWSSSLRSRSSRGFAPPSKRSCEPFIWEAEYRSGRAPLCVAPTSASAGPTLLTRNTEPQNQLSSSLGGSPDSLLTAARRRGGVGATSCRGHGGHGSSPGYSENAGERPGTINPRFRFSWHSSRSGTGLCSPYSWDEFRPCEKSRRVLYLVGV